jgi:glucosylceramidase
MATYAQLLVILAASSVCNGRSVSIWQSSEAYPSTSDPDRLIPYPAVNVSSRIDPSQPTITVNVAAKNQEILGFGGAITDSVASIFSQLKPELQDEVVEALWGPSGQRYNLGRLTIGATDFSTSIYSYNEVAGDLNMSYFTIDHDRLVIIPLALRAQQAASSASEDLQWLSTPWSPPGWMKRNGQSCHTHLLAACTTDFNCFLITPQARSI